MHEWFTELLYTPLGPISTTSISANPYPLHDLRSHHPPPLHVLNPNPFIEVGSSPPLTPSQRGQPRKRRRKLPTPSKSALRSLSSPSHSPSPKVPQKRKGKKVAPRSLSPLSSHSPSPKVSHKQKGKKIAPRSLSPLSSGSLSPKVPRK